MAPRVHASQDAPQVVTPEAVPLGFEDATVGTRGVAAVIDTVIMLVLLLVVQLSALFSAGALGAQDWVAVTIAVVLAFVVGVGYPVGFEALWRGRTPGKAALGLRVVTVEGAPIGFRHALIRGAIGIVELRVTIGAVALVVSALSRRGQRVGDHAAGTVVVREGSRRRRLQPLDVTVPPGYEGYAATLDPGTATADDYDVVRAFLQRRGELAPDARTQVAAQLAVRIAERLGVAPHPQVAPETFLVCFAARYQERDTARW